LSHPESPPAAAQTLRYPTCQPRRTFVPGSGNWVMIRPSGTRGLYIAVPLRSATPIRHRPFRLRRAEPDYRGHFDFLSVNRESHRRQRDTSATTTSTNANTAKRNRAFIVGRTYGSTNMFQRTQLDEQGSTNLEQAAVPSV